MQWEKVAADFENDQEEEISNVFRPKNLVQYGEDVLLKIQKHIIGKIPPLW